MSQTNLKPAGPHPWFKVQPRSAARVRLFCFPYAGGTSAIFRQWSRELPREIELVPALLPGRELKLKEPAYTQIEPLIETLAREITPFLDRPFAFLVTAWARPSVLNLRAACVRSIASNPIICASPDDEVRKFTGAIHTFTICRMQSFLQNLKE